MINSEDISVVVQGTIDKKKAEVCLKSVRKILPKSEIILSTWEGENVGGLIFDKVVFNKDPGAGATSLFKKKYNTNRQIVSTFNGLKISTRKYVLKLRSDVKLKNNNFVRYFLWANNQLVLRNKEFAFFKNKIVVDSHYTRDPDSKSYFARCFHPSDLFFFGLREDLYDLFDIPLQQQFSVIIDNCEYVKFCPEQYIFYTFCKKKGVKSLLTTECDLNDFARNETNHALLNNFFVLDHKKTGVCFPESVKKLDKKIVEDSILTSYNFLLKYRENLNKEFNIPNKFKNFSEKLEIQKYLDKLKNKKNSFFIKFFIVCKILIKSIKNMHKIVRI